ncbi:DNA primase [Sutterella sp.]|uniref:DNA primase n=1 Tax=Sutterella sp. TaxID=1981025 RepID=UPI0026E0F0EB|nr:DNA primase [Sutterella sp.]MDO5532066.1 DNA primase [Sutterella sp.]
MASLPAPMIPEGFISSLLDRADIVDVVGRYVTLKKGGRNFMACCPFHKEKTPSFSVSPSKQIYKCFGCGKAGNAIGFLMEMERLDFPEAVRRLAGMYGLEVPEDRSPARREARARAKTLSDFMKEAADYYTQCLKDSTRAIDYLKARELTGETAARFGLGYSPDGWHGLQAVFPGEKYNAKELTETGLVLEKNGRRYDAFRDRIMFPIRSAKGTVIGFGARTMKGDEQPKYLNSPETPIYHKGSELYGLYEGRTAIIEKGRAIVCEGYMDVIQLSQAGFRESVAALGTSITPEHVKKLFKLSDAVYFSFDGDSAGRKAARRALEAALPVIADTQAAHFVLLPPEHDPDSLIKAEGPEAYEREIEKALPLTVFLKSLLVEGKELIYAESRAKLAAEAKPLILSMKNAPVLRLSLMREVASLARLQLEDLQREWGIAPEPAAVPAPSRPTGLTYGRGGRRDGWGDRSDWGDRTGRDGWRRRPSPEPRVQVQDVRDRMLQCFLAYPKFLSEFSSQIEDEFVTSRSPAASRIVEVWRASADEDGTVANPATLLARLSDSPDIGRYMDLLSGELTLETSEKAARIELTRDFLRFELERTKARIAMLGDSKPDMEERRALWERVKVLEHSIEQNAEDERSCHRESADASRASAFAKTEAGHADMNFSSNPKVRALQEHLFGRAAMEAAEAGAQKSQDSGNADALREARETVLAKNAAAAFGAAPAAPAASPFGAAPASPFGSAPAPADDPFAPQPARKAPAGPAQEPAPGPVVARTARDDRDARFAALEADARRRAGIAPVAPAPADIPAGNPDVDDGFAPSDEEYVPDMPEGFDDGMDDAGFAGLAAEAEFAAGNEADAIPDADPDIGRRRR